MSLVRSTRSTARHDGRSIVFYYANDLYRLDAATEALIKITANPIDLISDAALSPDGKTIAYVPVFPAYGDGDVLFMTMGGARPFGLPDTIYHEYAVTWSPDGSRLAFAASQASGYPTEYHYVVEIMDVASASMTPIYETAAYIPASIAWSPDGARIAFSMLDGDTADIYTIQPDGAQLDRLTGDGRYNIRPRWSPDGTRISYSSSPVDGGYFQLYVMDADGRNPYLVYWRLPDYNVYNECWLHSSPQD